MSQADEILNGPEYFYCEREHCRLRIEVCLKRQKANQERRPFKSISFVSCEECDQGAKNQLLKTSVAMNPKRGKGERKLDCDHYGACLDLAAKKDWKSFNCESCLSFEAGIKEVPAMNEKKENTRICEECGEKPTISPGAPFCPSCMAIRSHKARPVKKKGPVKSKKKDTTKDKAEPQKPQQDLNTALTIEFSKHVSVLREVEKLAEEEVRPVDLQVVYMLKKYISSVEVVKST